jgi:hypothetical protein
MASARYICTSSSAWARQPQRHCLSRFGRYIQDATYSLFEMSQKCKDFVSLGERRFLDSRTCCAISACRVKSTSFGTANRAKSAN